MALSVAPLISLFGFAGLAVAVLIGELLESLLLLIRLRAHLGGRLFRDLANPIGAVLLASLAALAIAATLVTALGALLTQPILRERVARAGHEAVEALGGALERTLQALEPYLDPLQHRQDAHHA